MALDITGATVGYDQEGVQTLLDDIKASLITESIEKLRGSETDLATALDEIWRGESEEAFKSNMHDDVETICKALGGAYTALEAEITRTRDAMGEVDNQLVQKN